MNTVIASLVSFEWEINALCKGIKRNYSIDIVLKLCKLICLLRLGEEAMVEEATVEEAIKWMLSTPIGTWFSWYNLLNFVKTRLK